MLRVFGCISLLLASAVALADETSAIEIPITPFSNMESGYQATNPGFRVILKDAHGQYVAGGALTMDAVMRGRADDASQGSAYGKLILRVEMAMIDVLAAHKQVTGTQSGTLSICMAQDPNGYFPNTQCKNLDGNHNVDRPFQWLDKQVDFVTTANGDVQITHFYGDTGEGGTSTQLSLAVFHPAFGFAAPGKAFKDYQSPLVLDLGGKGTLDLVNVYDEATPIRFDLNGSGEVVRTGWVKPTAGLLFWDDGSGCAKTGAQFYGEYTGAAQGRRTFENGFRALAAQLDPQATGRVVAKDHPRLKIWRNLAQDGICKPSEVVAASSVVKEISLAYQTVPNVKLNEDNEVRLVGHYLGTDGNQHLIGDVWFKQRRNLLSRN